MYLSRALLCLLLIVSPELYASATNRQVPALLDVLRENVLPNHMRRHVDFLSKIHPETPDDRTHLPTLFTSLADGYVEKSKLLWTLASKKNVFAFEWQNKHIEEFLPDDWMLVRINPGALLYSNNGMLPSNSSSTMATPTSVDLKRISLTFSLVAYYYNSLALKHTNEEHSAFLLAKKAELALVIQERALTPFGAWTIASHYAPHPLPPEDSPKEGINRLVLQREVEHFLRQYETLNVDSETLKDFLSELSFEVTNGIIFRATPEYGHHDFSRLDLDNLFEQYKDLQNYWHDRLARRESAERISPRPELATSGRRIREIEDAQEQSEQDNVKKSMYQAFGLALMTSDFLEMPIVYERKLEAFMAPSKALHREATLRTLSRVHAFFTRHQALFINVFKERFEYSLMQIALLGAKKKAFSLPLYFHLIAKNYFLATPEYFDQAATHLRHIIVQLESTPPTMIAPTTSETASAEPKHHKKSMFSSITSALSRLTLSSTSLSEENSAQIISVTNPVFARQTKIDLTSKAPATPLPSVVTSSSLLSVNNKTNIDEQIHPNPDGFEPEKRRSSMPELCLRGLALPKVAAAPRRAELTFSDLETADTALPMVSPRKISVSPTTLTSPRLAIHFASQSPRISTDSELSSPSSPRSSTERSDAETKKLFRFNSFKRHQVSKSKDSVSTPLSSPRRVFPLDLIADSSSSQVNGADFFELVRSRGTIEVLKDGVLNEGKE